MSDEPAILKEALSSVEVSFLLYMSALTVANFCLHCRHPLETAHLLMKVWGNWVNDSSPKFAENPEVDKLAVNYAHQMMEQMLERIVYNIKHMSKKGDTQC